MDKNNAITDKSSCFRLADLIVPLALALALVLLSRISFIWFHALAELFAIVVGISLYLIASRSYVFTRNAFLLFLAQGFFWAAAVDLIHTLAYAGMGLIAHDDPNPATQLWLLARTLEAGALLLAPGYLGGRHLPRWSFAIPSLVALSGIALIFYDLLPAAYVVGKGLTTFKIATEYAIIAMLAAASLRLHLNRKRLDADLYGIMLGILALTMLSEFAFTVYVGVYDISNLIGHIFKFWAFWLLLLAISRWMLARPFRMLSRQVHTFDHMPMPVLLTDTAGIIHSCNAPARRLHPEGGVGRPLHEVWHPATLAVANCPICQTLAAGGEIETELHDAVTDRWAAIQLHPIRQEDETQGFVCVHSDATAAHRAQERLIQAEKMEALGQLTSGLAHDFGNLVSAMIGGLELLERRIGDDEKARRHFDLTKRAAQRAAEVTRSLLAVARKQTLAPRDIAIDAAIADLLPLLQQAVGTVIEIERRACPDCADLQARVDPTGLDNALLNLVINARDAMPNGGRITLDARALACGPQTKNAPPELNPGLYIVVGVSDTGCGMPPEVAARAFDPFFTTKGQGKGTGMGLPMVYGFARQSGGTATLVSEAGKGTTFHLYLPAVPRSAEVVKPTPQHDAGLARAAAAPFALPEAPP